MKKVITAIFVTFGFIALGLGLAGIFLPVLPTTPFFLLAAGLFAKGSSRFHTWFTQTKLYKKYIVQTLERKEMTKERKRNVLITISALLLIGFLCSPVWYAKALIAVIFCGHWYYFLFKIKTVQTIEDEVSEM